jgi:hypothetical protein
MQVRGAGGDHYFLTLMQETLSSSSAAVQRSFQNLDALLPGQVNVIGRRGRNGPAYILELKQYAQRLVCRHRYDNSVSGHLML